MSGAIGGAERVLAELASRLAAEGHDVSLLSFDAGGDSFYPLAPAIRRIFLPVGDATRPATIADMLRRLPALRRAAQLAAPDVAVGFMHSMFIPLGLALLGTGIPVIGSEHTSPDTYHARRAEHLLLRLALPTLRAITVPTEAIRAFYPASAQGKITVLPNPVATFAGMDRSGANPTKTILAIGRLQPVKDHTSLIDAFARLAPQHPDWQLRIVGDGPLRPQLQAQIAACGLQDRVTLPGFLSNLTGRICSGRDFRHAIAERKFRPGSSRSFGQRLARHRFLRLPRLPRTYPERL